jgi:DNA-binding CsgD family transcriptional regulator
MRVGVIMYGRSIATQALETLPGIEVEWRTNADRLTAELPARPIEGILLHSHLTLAPNIAHTIDEIHSRRPDAPIILCLSSRGRPAILAEVKSYQPLRDKVARRFGLTVRESQVLNEIRAGRTNREIAALLGMSLSTANRHVENILRKLDARNRTEAAVSGAGAAAR